MADKTLLNSYNSFNKNTYNHKSSDQDINMLLYSDDDDSDNKSDYVEAGSTVAVRTKSNKKTIKQTIKVHKKIKD